MIVVTLRTANAKSSGVQNRSMYIAIDQYPVDAGRLLHANNAWWEQGKLGLGRSSHKQSAYCLPLLWPIFDASSKPMFFLSSNH